MYIFSGYQWWGMWAGKVHKEIQQNFREVMGKFNVLIAIVVI
jgi:predicted small integral membrane protein